AAGRPRPDRVRLRFSLQPLEQLRRHGHAPHRDGPLRGSAAGRADAGRARRDPALLLQPARVIGAIAAGNSFSSIESIDDENRSSVRVDLSREIEDRVRVVARYTFYANEIANASPISYRRQTFLLSVIGSLEK